MQRRVFLNASIGLALPSVLAAASTARSGERKSGGRPPQRKQDLKRPIPGMSVTAIRRRAGTYSVATADGAVKEFREFDLRFKTDSSAQGPEPGKPAILHPIAPRDRVTVVFASPAEIGTFVQAVRD